VLDLGERRLSGLVLEALATFFGPSADGAELRRRFAQAVSGVATRFAANEKVLGIEVYNEPFNTSSEGLKALHDEVTAAVRQVDPGRLVFFEPDSIRNFLDEAPLSTEPAPPGSVYAPHVYTLAFSGSDAAHAAMTKETLARSNEHARAEANSWSTPLAITEFGYAPDGIQMENYMRWQLELQDELQASSFVWLWKEDSQGSWGFFDHDAATGAWKERDHVRRALSRVVPEAIAGWPDRFGYDRERRRFELAFRGDPAIAGPSRIYLPAPEDFAASFEVSCDGQTRDATRDPLSGTVDVECGGAGAHVIVIAAKEQ
jgi:endoglycosylceramidase